MQATVISSLISAGGGSADMLDTTKQIMGNHRIPP